MANKVKFDLEKMTKFKQKVDCASNDLGEISQELEKNLEQLKQDWQTDAGRKFFEEHVVDWQLDVKTYQKMLNVLSQMMDTAIKEYGYVENKAAGSAIQYLI